MKRSNEAHILMTLSFGGAIAITPFAIIRLLDGEWVVGLVDTLMVIAMICLGLYVYISRKVYIASLALSILAMVGLTIVIHLKGPALLFWAYPTMVGAFFILSPQIAVILTLLTALAISPALINQLTLTEIAMVMITLTVNNVFAYIFTTRMNQQRDQLSLLVSKDTLTGAGNRRALDEKLIELIAFHKRTKQVASLIMLDVDHFKSVNDNYGHAVGDQVLIGLADLVKKRIRTTDCLYRFGGEEFVVIAIGANLNAAEAIAEDLRQIVERGELIENKTITVSLGVAEYIAEETATKWLGRGDKALYQAKESGRNKTCVAV